MNYKGISAFWLKMIAIIGMTLQHTAIVFNAQLPFGVKTVMYLAGGLTFPIMAFLLVEGYRKTSNLGRYLLRLLIFAVIAQIPFMLAFNTNALNIMFTLLLGLILLWLYDSMNDKFVFLALFLLVNIFTMNFDWGLIGLPLVVAFGTIKHPHNRIILPISLMVILEEIYLLAFVSFSEASCFYAFFYAGCLCVIPLLLMYSGRKGKSVKYLFYVFYPAHLILLFVLRYLLFK